ncbi:MAG: hypothetical protein R3C49_27555 [Planctomycetaceae bacterium]
MQTATFVKTVKWLYALEVDAALEYFQEGFQEYLKAGRSGVSARIEDTYARGIQLNTRVRQIESHVEATALLDAFGLSDLYDSEWWQGVVSVFLRVLADGEDGHQTGDSVRETIDQIQRLSDRMRILVSCVGPLQQLVVPTSVLRLSDFDDVLTMEVHASAESDALSIGRMEAVLTTTDELYTTMCRIYGKEEPVPVRVLHMSSDAGFRFDLSGDSTVIVDLKKLLVDMWLRIRNQDVQQLKELNRAIAPHLAPYQKLESRLEKNEITQETAGQLRHQLSALAMKMFDLGVQIREIPDTDTIDNRRLMEQIRQRRLTGPAAKAPDAADPVVDAPPATVPMPTKKRKQKPAVKVAAPKKAKASMAKRSRAS